MSQLNRITMLSKMFADIFQMVYISGFNIRMNFRQKYYSTVPDKYGISEKHFR